MNKYKTLVEKHDFKTGDLLLYHHKDKCNNCCNLLFTIFTDCIMCCTNSKYSHSSIIVKDPSWDKNLKGLYVLESSYEPFGDAEDNEVKLGCELVPLEKVLEEYNGDIYWRHIECNRNDEFFQHLERAHSVVHNRPYDIDPLDWIKAKFKLHFGNTRRKDTFYCSAMVAFVYTRLGLLESNTEWTLVSPEMLGTEHKIDEVKFINCTIYDEVQIK